ncbi:hypothetical protein HYH03_015440 [Edaphochlamys debaryana]|uniref:Uncharacterized protein n=1 Tax=Edaphochlamys debaryana TaxID=47281 RepID=A0A835XM57_9CHLO|nr:hypothetical protein HYH03_015440 [Edaphochlamys debaryana]|eukprot:KAG2485857.1 hypothetical protein HYH03_015440 [Edaphochlamys debaryana]
MVRCPAAVGCYDLQAGPADGERMARDYFRHLPTPAPAAPAPVGGPAAAAMDAPPPWALEMQQQMGQLMQQTGQMQQQMGQMQQQMGQIASNLEHVAIMAARTANATALAGAPLMGLPTAAGPVPPGFPATAGALHRLKGASVDQLLQAYGLPITGTVPVRRTRLAQHVGACGPAPSEPVTPERSA